MDESVLSPAEGDAEKLGEPMRTNDSGFHVDSHVMESSRPSARRSSSQGCSIHPIKGFAEETKTGWVHWDYHADSGQRKRSRSASRSSRRRNRSNNSSSYRRRRKISTSPSPKPREAHDRIKRAWKDWADGDGRQYRNSIENFTSVYLRSGGSGPFVDETREGSGCWPSGYCSSQEENEHKILLRNRYISIYGRSNPQIPLLIHNTGFVAADWTQPIPLDKLFEYQEKLTLFSRSENYHSPSSFLKEHIRSSISSVFRSVLASRFDMIGFQDLLNEQKTSFVIEVNTFCSSVPKEYSFGKNRFLVSDVQELPRGIWNDEANYWKNLVIVEKPCHGDDIFVFNFPSLVSVEKSDESYSERRSRTGSASTRASKDLSHPLDLAFRDLVRSGSSASKFADSDVLRSQQLVLLDLLRVVIDNWLEFITKKNSAVKLRNINYDHTSHFKEELMDAESDCTSIRDLSSIFEYLIGLLNIEADDKSTRRHSSNPQRLARPLSSCRNLSSSEETTSSKTCDIMALSLIIKNARVRLRVTENRANELRSMIGLLFKLSINEASEMQAGAVNRLTVIAAIFLPLTLASSLLSMTTRAKDLGYIWYDYFGLCIVFGMLAAVIYQMKKAADQIKTSRDWPVGRNVISGVRNAVRLSSMFPGSLLTQLNVLAMLFLLLVTGSFLVGMIISVPTALKALGYGTAGIAGIAVIRTLLSIAHILPYFKRALVKEYKRWRDGHKRRDVEDSTQ